MTKKRHVAGVIPLPIGNGLMFTLTARDSVRVLRIIDMFVVRKWRKKIVSTFALFKGFRNTSHTCRGRNFSMAILIRL